jgi:hypothetical protein
MSLYVLLKIYLIQLSVAQTPYHRIIGLVNNKIKRVWKQEVMLNLRVLSWYLPGQKKKKHPQSGHNVQCSNSAIYVEHLKMTR